MAGAFAALYRDCSYVCSVRGVPRSASLRHPSISAFWILRVFLKLIPNIPSRVVYVMQTSQRLRAHCGHAGIQPSARGSWSCRAAPQYRVFQRSRVTVAVAAPFRDTER